MGGIVSAFDGGGEPVGGNLAARVTIFDDRFLVDGEGEGAAEVGCCRRGPGDVAAEEIGAEVGIR